MAESKGALIAKTVQKHAGRAKEKVFIVLFTLRGKSDVSRWWWFFMYLAADVLWKYVFEKIGGTPGQVSCD